MKIKCELFEYLYRIKNLNFYLVYYVCKHYYRIVYVQGSNRLKKRCRTICIKFEPESGQKSKWLRIHCQCNAIFLFSTCRFNTYFHANCSAIFFFNATECRATFILLHSVHTSYIQEVAFNCLTHFRFRCNVSKVTALVEKITIRLLELYIVLVYSLLLHCPS